MEVISNFKITCGSDIRKAMEDIDNKFYVQVKTFKEDHIFDEDKSVRWNREEVARQNALQRSFYERARKMAAESYENLYLAIFTYIMEESVYDFKFTLEEAKVIWANTVKHHEGEPWNWVDDMAESARDFYNVRRR